MRISELLTCRCCRDFRAMSCSTASVSPPVLAACPTCCAPLPSAESSVRCASCCSQLYCSTSCHKQHTNSCVLENQGNVYCSKNCWKARKSAANNAQSQVNPPAKAAPIVPAKAEAPLVGASGSIDSAKMTPLMRRAAALANAPATAAAVTTNNSPCNISVHGGLGSSGERGVRPLYVVDSNEGECQGVKQHDPSDQKVQHPSLSVPPPSGKQQAEQEHKQAEEQAAGKVKEAAAGKVKDGASGSGPKLRNSSSEITSKMQPEKGHKKAAKHVEAAYAELLQKKQLLENIKLALRGDNLHFSATVADRPHHLRRGRCVRRGACGNCSNFGQRKVNTTMNHLRCPSPNSLLHTLLYCFISVRSHPHTLLSSILA